LREGAGKLACLPFLYEYTVNRGSLEQGSLFMMHARVEQGTLTHPQAVRREAQPGLI